MNGSTSPFPSFSSESSSVSAAQEALTAAINTPVPVPAAQKPNGSVHWDAPPPSSAASSASNIWGSGNNVSISEMCHPDLPSNAKVCMVMLL